MGFISSLRSDLPVIVAGFFTGVFLCYLFLMNDDFVTKQVFRKNYSTSDGFTAYELTESISNKANLSETFIATFCGHRLTVFVGQPQICLYKRSDDIHISGDIIRAGAWEPSEVSFILNVIQNYTKQFGSNNVLFVDVGANLGGFTLPVVAACGIRVVAIEPLDETVRRLSTSILLNKFSDNVTLVTHPVSRATDECLNFIKIPEDNRGNSPMSKVKCDVSGHTSVTLDDLFAPLLTAPKNPNVHIVMKMDIEAFEVYAILGGRDFLKSGAVKIILMEWVLIQINMMNNNPRGFKKDADTAIKFLVFDAGYSVYNLPDGRPVTFKERMKTWSKMIVFAKPGYFSEGVLVKYT